MSARIGGYPCCSRIVAAHSAPSRQWTLSARTTPRNVWSVSPCSSRLYGNDSSHRCTFPGVLAASMMARSRGVNADRGGAGLVPRSGGPPPLLGFVALLVLGLLAARRLPPPPATRLSTHLLLQ